MDFTPGPCYGLSMSLSIEHEAPIELCREHPQVVISILTKLLHITLPPFSSLRVTDPNSRQTQATGYRSDNAFLFEQQDTPVVAVVIEPQRSINDKKRRSWPKYTADLHAEVDCDTYLVVLAFTRPVARWARSPITSFQPGSQFAPHVIGPDDLSRVTLEEQVREDPWLAALSALMHANDEQGEQDMLTTLRVTKEAIRRILNSGLPDGHDLVRACYASADFRIGIHAFMNKREPQWTGE